MLWTKLPKWRERAGFGQQLNIYHIDKRKLGRSAKSVTALFK